MKRALFIILLVMVATLGVAREKNNKKAKEVKEVPVYIIGASISFADSVAYFTEVQKFDAVVLNALAPEQSRNLAAQPTQKELEVSQMEAAAPVHTGP